MNGSCKPTVFIESARRSANVKSEDFFTHNHWSNIVILYIRANERFACQLHLDPRPHSPAALYGANPLSLAFGLKIISINFPIHQSTSAVSACDLPTPPCLSSPRENISHPRKTDIIMFIFPSHIYIKT